MVFEKISEKNYRFFQEIMIEYYRDGEDADTCIDTIKNFIDGLFCMINDDKIDGVMVKNSEVYQGFCLWMKDDGENEFSEIQDYGTILEIGVRPAFRNKGVGMNLVNYAEDRLKQKNVKGFYVSSYGPSEEFWELCGYSRTQNKASNGLTIFTKCKDRVPK